MRNRLTRDSLQALMRELALTANPKRSYRVYLVGGGTAVLKGWRESLSQEAVRSAVDDFVRRLPI